MAENEYSIVAGWNDAAGLVNVEELTPASSIVIPRRNGVYYLVKAAPFYRRGQKRFSPDGGSSYAGFPTVTWRLLSVSHSAFAAFYTAYNGQCTVRTTTGVKDVYSNWNAYVDVPDPADVEEEDFGFYNADVIIRLVEAPSA